jgi:short-subunit dehydrogenase
MTKIKGSNVLITGGGSGIGRIMGRVALEKGAKSLTIWDINEQNMADTKAELGAKGLVFTQKVDVSNATQVEEAANIAKKNAGGIDILINCAGIVANNKTFDEQSVSDITRTMNINALAPMLVTLQFLPDMLKRNFGHICNIASAAGMISNPRMSVYAASKWATLGWSDSIRIELEQAKSKVKVSTVAPYFISTGMFNGVKSRFFPILKPEPTAKNIIKAIERNKWFKGLPFGFHFIRFCQAILPIKIFDFIFGEVVGIFHGMDNFTGRK